MATSTSPCECDICNNEFDDENRSPRILGCFHTLCSECVTNLILRNARRCPFCRRTFRAHRMEDVMVNNKALDLIKYYSVRETRSKRFKRCDSNSSTIRMAELKSEVLEFITTCNTNWKDSLVKLDGLEKEMMMLKEKIIRNSSHIENEVLAWCRESLTQNYKAVEELDNMNRFLKEQMRDITNKSDNGDTKNTLSATSDPVHETKAVLDSSASDENLTTSTREKELARNKDHISKSLDELNLEQGIRAPRNLGVVAANIQENATTVQKPVKLLRNVSETMNDLVLNGKVFAVYEINGRSEYAQLSCSDDGKLCLHGLEERTLPPDSRVMEHTHLMTLEDTESRLVFLDLGIGNSILGRMYIRLSPDSPETRQFSALCTGVLGHSYLNTNILEVNSRGNAQENVTFGDYENNDGSGGKDLIPGAGTWTGERMMPWQAGTVEGLFFDGCSKAAQFLINTRDCPGNVNPAIGRVEEGLSVLTEAVSHFANILEVRIVDCGAVLQSVPDLENCLLNVKLEV